MSTPSYTDSKNAKPPNTAMMGWFADQTFAKPADRKDPRIDLVNANRKGLPPVTLINARIDPLRSDSDLLGAALEKAGVRSGARECHGTGRGGTRIFADERSA